MSHTERIANYCNDQGVLDILEEIDKLSELKELQFINHSVSETLDKDTVTVQINIFEGEKFISHLPSEKNHLYKLS